MQRKAGLLLWAAALAAAVLSATVRAEWRLGLGAEYTRGDYGAGFDETRLWYFPFSLHEETVLWAWSVTVPYLVVRGPGRVVPGGGGSSRAAAGQGTGVMGHAVVSTGGAAGATRTDSGMGDVVLSASVRLAEEGPGGRPRVDLTGTLKLATADENRRLGTGENDYAAEIGLEKGLFYAALGYKVYGDPPGLELDDVFYGLVGLRFTTSAAWRARR